MTVLEKIKKCVSLVWDFQEIYGEEDVEEFCHNELSTYPQHNEIMDYFKQIENLEKENKLLGERCNQLLKDKGDLTDANSGLLSQVAATTKRVIELEQQIEKAVEIIRELASTVREGVTCHYLVDNGALHRATLFLKEIKNESLYTFNR